MNKPVRYSPEVRERAVRMVLEHQGEYPSQWAAMQSIASKIGCSAETLRKWLRKATADQGVTRIEAAERERLIALERENRELFGERARQHGHNYRLELTVRGEPDPRTGMVIDLKRIQEVLEREIMQRFDHRDLNADTPFFEKDPPTPENLARVIFRLLAEALPAGLLHGVRLRQEPDLWVDVRGEAPA